jgi:hypothetical protein
MESFSLGNEFCEHNSSSEVCQTYTGGNLKCVNAFPGINPLIISQNLNPMYLKVYRQSGNVTPEIFIRLGGSITDEISICG